MFAANLPVGRDIRELVEQQQVAYQEKRNQGSHKSRRAVSPGEHEMRPHDHQGAEAEPRRDQTHKGVSGKPGGIAEDQDQPGQAQRQ